MCIYLGLYVCYNQAKKKCLVSITSQKNIGRVGRDFFSLTHTNPWSWMASIKVCLVVIVFISSNCTSVHPEIDNLMVGELIFRTARLFLGRRSKFFSRIGKKS